VKNLERDPRATIQIEAGREYEELRGVMMECDVHVERDPELIVEYGLMLAGRFGHLRPETRAVVLKQAGKRVGLRFHPTRIVSWDHRKLDGGR
jgi:hypothetical protein